jgi:hypothetical protein
VRAWQSNDRALLALCEAIEREKRALHKTSDLESKLNAARRQLSAAQSAMNSTLDAQIEGTKAGLTFSLYEPRLKEAAAKLEAAKARVASIEAEIEARGIVPGLSVKAAAQQQAQAIYAALSGFENDLFSEEVATPDKNKILKRIIEKIVPSPDYTPRIYLRA